MIKDQDHQSDLGARIYVHMEAITAAGVKEGGQLTGQPPAVGTGSIHTTETNYRSWKEGKNRKIIEIKRM